MALPPPDPDVACLVTGASSGIGVDIARELAARGRTLVLAARRRDRLEAVAAELRAAHGVRAEVVTADLTDPGAREELWGAVTDLGLSVGVLVNNAGWSTVGPVAASDPGREVGMVRTNVEAVVDLTTRALPAMVAAGAGGVLNVASTAAFQPLPGQAGYAASKAFVLNYSWALGEELRGSGVAVTALCPGPTATEFVEAAGAGNALEGVPSRIFASSAAVARAGVRGLEAGQAVVIPGAANRVGALGGQLTPRRLLLPVLRRVYPAMRATGH